MADLETITITCPHCGAASAKSFPWAMTHFTTRCTECRKAYLIDRAYLLRNIQRLDIRVSGGLIVVCADTRGVFRVSTQQFLHLPVACGARKVGSATLPASTR